jgi:hypothetical protein
MSNCENCELNCPVILAVNQTARDLESKLAVFDERETARRTAAARWAERIVEAQPEERAQPIIVDGESVGDLFALRDDHELFASITRNSDDERRLAINRRLEGLRREREARKAACADGPGQRFIVLGGIVCRSEIGTQPETTQAIQAFVAEGVSTRHGSDETTAIIETIIDETL